MIFRLSGGLAAAACAFLPACAHAQDHRADEILVTAKWRPAIENAPASHASVDADTIAATVNAMNVEDTLKYLPSLTIRKRHIGDTQSPLATRTSGLGASARSLIYADGALLSALIGNNNTSASPRWSLVSPQEIARVDVLYGPFSAAYPGNSIGAVVNITTRMPDAFEAVLNAGVNVQAFDLYGTHRTLPAYQLGGTIGDRFGPLALFASVDHVDSRSQPLGFVTAARPAGTSGSGVKAVGGYDDLNRTGQPIRVLGASGFEHQLQDRLKLKAALDLSPGLRATYVGALFRNTTDSTVETYLRDAATGAPLYAGALNIDGRAYTVAASGFSGSVHHSEQLHWSHSLSLTGSGGGFDWQLIGTRYAFGKDEQRVAGTALPAAQAGGAGTVTRLDGTGWSTLDAKAAWRTGAHTLGLGAHGDWFALDSNRYATADWIAGSGGALNLRSHGRTRTLALWAQDAWRLLPQVTLTLGARQEWWKAYDGVNFSLSPAISVAQPGRAAGRFSPKATLAWDPAADWTVRLSFGQAWRFPTVGELYQIVTTPVAAVPNPNLRPERARSGELAVEHHDSRGTIRLALFGEAISDALISQTGPLNGTTTLATFVQNVDRTRARGVELAFQRSDVLPGVDLSGSLTYADAVTSMDTAFPAAVGKLLPSVPHWRATAVATWRPAEGVSLTAAARSSSRNYATLDNSDTIGNTYQGFDKYLVVDLRAQFRVGEDMALGLGVDNLTNDRYFLFHPFTQRAFTADVRVGF
ncbi:MAG: TonB-dependent receptor [Pseudomonadota bacterium]